MRQPSSIFGQLAEGLSASWRTRARPEQLPPDWKGSAGGVVLNGWVYNAARGTGKTRTGAEWVCEEVANGSAKRIALVAPTAHDVRHVMIEGPSGILSVAPSWNRPEYEPSRRRLSWRNGAEAFAYSAEEPERLRGPQHDLAWVDELAAMPNASATWDQLMFGLRLGEHPRWLVTTTPRPLKLLKELMARSDVMVSKSTTFDNAANLAAGFIETIKAKFDGTRLGRQELYGEMLEDHAGALWTQEMLARCRYSGPLPDMKRVVVAIDPSGTGGQEDNGDSIGIVVAGLGTDDFGYVLADRTVKASPAVWGRRAVDAYREFKADRIIGEKNFGGAMIAHTIRVVDPNVSYRDVVASRGKVARSEPVAALYEQNRIRHVGAFTELEDQQAAMTSSGFAGDGSPDRVDALVWALSELMTGPVTPQAMFGRYGAYVPAPRPTHLDGPITDGILAGGHAVSR